MINFEQIEPHKLIRLANGHINHFRLLIRSNSRNVNKAECQMYQDIWESVLAEKGQWKQLSPAAQREIRDAIYSREYDDLFDLTDDSFDD